MDATDTIDYHLAVCKLTAMINDNHSYTTSKIIEDHYGNRFLPVKFQIIENKTIIVEKYSDSIARLNNLEIGDILLSINKKPIEYIRDSLSYYFSGSNQQSVQHTISFFLSRSTDTSLFLDIQRKDSVLAIKSKTYPRLLLSQERKKKLSNKTIDTISNSILYLDLSQLNYSNAESIFSSVLGFKFLILDLRKNCPFILYELGKILFAEKTEFFSMLIPQYQKPGLFTFKIGDSIGPNDYNEKHFNGHLILLIDERTQSIGEFTTMALSMYEKSITIGRSTAGADGNVSAVYLPGNITTIITGIGIYWPDGGITQRCGITPAIEVKSSIESVILGQDDILLAAIKYANNN
jgi:C-terminal processing protease CtpA/Prc